MPMNSRTRVRLALAALLVVLVAFGASPAIAGTVYVSLASNMTVDGLDQTTEIALTNPLAEATTVSVHYIPYFTDGADRPEGFQPMEVIVQAGETLILTDVADSGSRGMAEITAAPLVGISASLVSTNPSGATSRAQLPVIGSEELVRGGKFHMINGLVRDQTTRSSLGLVNLSQTTNTCLVQTIAAAGNALIGVTSIVVPPLSGLYFDDAVLASDIETGSDVRVQSICGGDSYAFSVVRDIETGAVNTLTPAADGSSSLRAPGTRVVCEQGAFCFEKPGTFIIPSPSNPFIFFDLFPPSSNYGSIRVQFAVKVGAPSSINESGFHGLFWLFRNLQWNNTFAYVNYRPGRSLLINNSLVNTSGGNSNRTTASVSLQQGQTYLVDYIYDARNRATRVTLRDLDGNVVANMEDRASLGTVAIQNGFRLEFGLELGPVEVPTYGWVYSDLVVIFAP